MSNNLIDTTFSGKNISSAVSVYEYVVPVACTLRIQLRLAAVSGGGDYTAHLTLNDGDVQSDDVMGPKTTYTAGAGETAFWMASMSLDVLAGDVINIFVKGLAGDTSESGSVRIFSDNYATHSVADIWAALVSGLTTVGSIGKLLVDRIDAAISSRATPADVVTSVAVSATVAAAVSTGSLAIEAGYTFRQQVSSTILGDLSAATELWLAIKSKNMVDSTSMIFIEKTDGLTRVNGSPYATPTHGSLVVSGSSGAWLIDIYIDEVATGLLFGINANLAAGLKAEIGVDEVSVWEGDGIILDGVVRTS